MTTFDLTPFYRSSIGFDRIASLLDTVSRADQNQSSYPPYNIELTGEDQYRITMAVAGFAKSELDIESKQNTLVIAGRKNEESSTKSQSQFLHQGIAARGFERRFQLVDYVRVVGAQLENGLLHIDLLREIPEALKPQKIAIDDTAAIETSGSTIEDKVA